MAAEPIARGRTVWLFHEGLDAVLPSAHVRALPSVLRAFLETYAYTPRENPGVVVLCGDHTRFMNHSAAPNVVVRAESRVPYGEYVAAVDIAAGEELTCDYFAFDEDAASKLLARPLRPNVGEEV